MQSMQDRDGSVTMYSRLRDDEDEPHSNSTSLEDDNDSKAVLPPSAGATSYGAVPHHHQQQQQQDKSSSAPSIFCSCRLLLYVMGYFGMFCSLSLRTGLTVAIVAMVNNTDVSDENNLATASSNASTNVDEQCYPEEVIIRQHTGARTGEFYWTRSQQGIVLSSFYYGYIVSIIPAGWLADHFGGKWMFGCSILIPSVMTLLIPAAATVHFGLLVLLRVVTGLFEGGKVTALYRLLAHWTPARELSVAVTAIFSAVDIAVIVTMAASGALCDYGFAGGWPSVFYVFGLVGFVYSVVWFLLCYDSPSGHPFISKSEQVYLETEIEINGDAAVKRRSTPWRAILTSLPVWALAATVFCHEWTYNLMMTFIPVYFHDILGLSMTENGLMGTLPFAAMFITVILSGIITNVLLFHANVSTTSVRKIMCSISLVPCTLCLILTGFLGCNIEAIVGMFMVAVSFLGLNTACSYVNHFDIAPLHMGVLKGLISSVGFTGGMLAPHVMEAVISSQSTRSEWQIIFYICAALNAVGTVLYLLFGSGELQEWARPGNDYHIEYELHTEQKK